MTQDFYRSPIRFDEDGFCGQLHKHVTPELCARLGRAAGCLFPGGRLGVACSGAPGAKALLMALCGGMLAGGAQVWDFGACPGVVFDFCMVQSGADFGFYLEGDTQVSLRAVRQGGIAAQRDQERKLEIKSADLTGEEFAKPGEYTPAPAFAKRYPFALLALTSVPLAGTGVTVRSSGREVSAMMQDALERLGCRPSPELSFQISADGRFLSAHTAATGYVFMDRLHALCCLSEFMRGGDVAVEQSAPRALDRLASQYERRVLRYSSIQEDEGAWALAGEQLFLRDGMMMAMRVLSFLKEHDIALREALSLIPDFYLAKRFVAAGPVRQTFYPQKNGGVEVRPVKSGKGVWVLAESETAETAMELCDFYEKKIKNAPEQQEGTDSEKGAV